MKRIFLAIGGALIGYGLYFFIFEDNTLEMNTDYMWIVNLFGTQREVYSKEILAWLAIIVGLIIAAFVAIAYARERRR